MQKKERGKRKEDPKDRREKANKVSLTKEK